MVSKRQKETASPSSAGTEAKSLADTSSALWPALPADDSLVRIVKRLALLFALVVGVGLPGGYFALNYSNLAEHVEISAMVRASRITSLVTANPKSWPRQLQEMEEVLLLSPPVLDDEIETVRNAVGHSLAVVGIAPKAPVMVRTSPFYGAGHVVGEVEIVHSYRKVLMGTFAVGLLGLLLGVLVYAAILVLPLRALQRASSALVNEKKALQESEERYRILFAHAMDGILLLDMEGNIVSVNNSFARMHGYSGDEFINKNLRELDTPETQAQAPQRFARIRAGESIAFEVEHFHKDGHIVPLEVTASEVDIKGKQFVLAFHRDITERKQAEKLLASREARLRAILDSAMEAIITADECRRIVLFNPAAEIMFGYSANQAIGMPLNRLIPERFHTKHDAHLKRFGEGGNATLRIHSARREVIGLRRNGEEFPADASVSQVSENNTKLFTVILRDIGEKIRKENELRRLQAELREFAVVSQSLREREKSRFARELHDELGQALTALKMDVAWIMERLPDGTEFLMAKLAGMQVILGDMMLSTRRIASNLRPLILDDLGLIPATEWLVENFMDYSCIDCQLDIPDPSLDLPEPYATAVFRILQESLTNISKHAHASLVQISIRREDENVRLSVRDNGSGFVSTDPRKPDSYGLMGLRERAHLIGGTIQIDSAPGQGTVVDLCIPIARPEENNQDFTA